jgi:carboxypeptidase Taq
MAVHESQSLLMEMQICRGRPFLEFAAPIIAGAFGRGQDECSVEKLASACHRIARSYIRVDADELTYPLHVILRYEMEQALLAGSLAIREIPDAWDSAMDDLLGLRTGDDFENGCMQDVHWFAGLVGYFPCYTLGALMAAQLMAAIKAAMPDLDSDIRNGDFAPVRDWLQRRVHSLGRLHEGLDLLTAATGSALSSGAFLQHLESRYGQPRP